MNTLRFKVVDDGVTRVDGPVPQVFFVSREFLREGLAEVRPLTVRGLLLGLAENAAWSLLWWIKRAAWRSGFLVIADGASRGSWRWRFWRPRRATLP